ncbi:hypothetical protein N0V88_002734 [Collariella sp. IMI 366227]|nr:hypothetical protein N0V88_002734 [Collariella sp. IMI 366227]
MSADGNELLDAFKAAALSVTKLYKTSASAQAKSRADGYQDCLEDLLLFLDKEHLGQRGDSDAHRIRKWRRRSRQGRTPYLLPADPTLPARRNNTSSTTPLRPQQQHRPPNARLLRPAHPHHLEEVDIVVPSQDTFNFQSAHPYPHDEAMRLANLDLSDSTSTTTHTSSSPNTTTTARSTPRSRNRHARSGPPGRSALGRGAGQKRKVDLAEIFGLGSLDYGNGKDMFGGGKRGRFI